MQYAPIYLRAHPERRVLLMPPILWRTSDSCASPQLRRILTGLPCPARRGRRKECEMKKEKTDAKIRPFCPEYGQETIKRTHENTSALSPFRGKKGGTNPVRAFLLAFFVRAAPQKSGGKLLVGLLTDVSRRLSGRHRISAAFPTKPLRPSVTCFRRKRIYSTITAIELHVAAAFAAVPAAKHVQDSHLIPLFSTNKDACPTPSGAGSRICHKSRMFLMQLSVKFSDKWIIT